MPQRISYIITYSVRIAKRVCAVLIFLWIVFPFFAAEAARLYFDPSESAVARGDEFSLTMRVDTEGECMNAIEAHIRFSTSSLRAVDVSTGQSFLTLWVDPPRIVSEEGFISFSGGIPGGYCGQVPGDTEISDVVGKIIFRTPSFTIGEAFSNEANVVFENGTKVLLNDGYGSPAALALGDARISILKSGGAVEEEWRQEIREDAVSPEPFVLQIYQDEKTSQGKYFVIFSTTDKQTGIDHYEVMETDERGMLSGTERRAQWVLAESPYILEDQTLSGIIHVKAVDKAGNEAIATLRSEEVPQRIQEAIARAEQQRKLMGWLLVVVVLVFVVRVAYRLWKHKHRSQETVS